jgi:undecaprenyl-diphosphatase
MYELFDILKVIFLGIIEGVTEWLPVSSTGHMILFEDYLSLGVSEDFLSMFLVVIQLGAILAVPVLFFDKLCPFGKNKTKEDSMKIWQLWLKVIIGIIPVGIIGFLFDDMIDELFLSGEVKSIVVAIALVVWGVAFIVVEYYSGIIICFTV